jgi:aspartyl-tRNA(Asn)/glutamyl-tRNA(Gln) amidotransferase subunit B
VEELRVRLPELAPQRCARFVSGYGLPEYDAGLLTGTKAMADYYEDAAGRKQLSGAEQIKYFKDISNWMLGDLSRLLNLRNQDITDSPVTPGHLVELIDLVNAGTVSVTMGKTVLEEAFQSGGSPSRIVAEKGYTQISDSSGVEPVVRQAIEDNPKAVDDYIAGKETAAKFLVGQVMKLTKGQAKPELVNQLVVGALEEMKQAMQPVTPD